LALSGRHPAAPDSWRVIRELVKALRESPDYEILEMYSEFAGRSVAFDIPNPGDLLDMLASAEGLFTPEFIRQKQEYWRKHAPEAHAHIAEYENSIRLRAYEGIFDVLYGDRWKAYKDLTGFEDFENWRASLDLKKHPRTEDQAAQVARTVLDNLSANDSKNEGM
jgi:hypothetical protein